MQHVVRISAELGTAGVSVVAAVKLSQAARAEVQKLRDEKMREFLVDPVHGPERRVVLQRYRNHVRSSRLYS